MLGWQIVIYKQAVALSGMYTAGKVVFIYCGRMTYRQQSLLMSPVTSETQVRKGLWGTVASLMPAGRTPVTMLPSPERTVQDTVAGSAELSRYACVLGQSRSSRLQWMPKAMAKWASRVEVKRPNLSKPELGTCVRELA